MKFIYWALGILFLTFTFFLSASSSFAADIVINEFLVDPDTNQWVELYNKGVAPVNIGGWFIDDSGGTQKFTIPNDTVINSGEFKVFTSSYFNLNRATPDIVQLLNGAAVEDSYSYDVSPGTNKSYGRETDGFGSWVIFSSPTKGSSNNASSPEPTATPTPIPINTPTPTLKPSATPTESQSLSEEAFPTLVLGSATGGSEISNAPTGNLDLGLEKVRVEKGSGFPKILIFVGALFLVACGILIFRNYRKGKKDDNAEF